MISIKSFVTLPLIALSFNAFAARNSADLAAQYFIEESFGVKNVEPVDWAQPPLGCVEEMIPHIPSRPCLDLTQVASPLKDWPPNLSSEDRDYWYGQRRGILYCRAAEVLRREAIQPGSQSAGAIESAWMAVDAVSDYDTKVKAIYEASERYGVPPHVLTGAVYQESMFSELGISSDGGNYSCGVEQINLIGWCGWANAQSSADKTALGWTQAPIDCRDSNLINLNLITPFYNIALSRLDGLPGYRLNKSHFQDIQLKDVISEWPKADSATNIVRYQAVTSFINNCADPRYGILAKANELRSIYSAYLSPAMKAKDRYLGKTRFARQCREVAKDDAYPLHAGWLMAVASYNAGPRAIDAVTHYNQWSANQFNDPVTLRDFTPDKLIDSIYWSGKWNRANDKIEFTNTAGAARNWIWFKGCIAQRHIARVMQHVTLLPDFFVQSIEAPYGCSPSSRTPDGKVITSVPPVRQATPGVKNPPPLPEPRPVPNPLELSQTG